MIEGKAISVEDALEKVLATANVFETEYINIEQSIGRVIAKDILLDRDLPAFDRVCMDGIAVNYTSIESGQRVFQIEKLQAAGEPKYTLKDKLKCVEIMTGAVLPENTDTVIRYEDLMRIEDSFEILIDPVNRKNIHFKGCDLKKDSKVLNANSRIKAIDINVLATLGISEVPVKRLPRIAVISSGNELVDINQIPKEYQIRRSNVYMLQSRLNEIGAETEIFHFPDNFDFIVNKLNEISGEFDALVLSGAVSKGKFDYIPDALKKVGFDKIFHGVKQRPGKPFWFGNRGKVVAFALPGNPVSSLACLCKYVIPWIEAGLQIEPSILSVLLTQDVAFKPDLSLFAEAKLNFTSNGQLEATVERGNGSGDIINPTRMDGFIELPRGHDVYQAGECFIFHPFFPIFK